MKENYFPICPREEMGSQKPSLLCWDCSRGRENGKRNCSFLFAAGAEMLCEGTSDPSASQLQLLRGFQAAPGFLPHHFWLYLESCDSHGASGVAGLALGWGGQFWCPSKNQGSEQRPRLDTRLQIQPLGHGSAGAVQEQIVEL